MTRGSRKMELCALALSALCGAATIWAVVDARGSVRDMRRIADSTLAAAKQHDSAALTAKRLRDLKLDAHEMAAVCHGWLAVDRTHRDSMASYEYSHTGLRTLGSQMCVNWMVLDKVLP